MEAWRSGFLVDGLGTKLLSIDTEGPPHGRRPLTKESPRGETHPPTPTASLRSRRRGAPGGLRAGQGPRPGCARALCNEVRTR